MTNLHKPAGRFFVWAILVGLLLPGLLLPWTAHASSGSDGEMPTELTVPVKAFLSQATATPGGTFQVAVVYEVPRGAHIQENEFFFAKPVDGEPFAMGPPVLPKAGDFEGIPIYQGRTVVYYAARLSRDLPPGQRNLHLLVGRQACIEEPTFACFAPEESTVDLPIEVVPTGTPTSAANKDLFSGLTRTPTMPEAPGGAAQANASTQETPGGSSALTQAAEPSAAATQSPASVKAEESNGAPGGPGGGASPKVETGGLAGRLQDALARRSILAFLLVFLGGIATSFTPCVYPMIPITISYIGGRSKSKLGGLFLSVFFVLGIALTYSTLGVLAATSGALFGSAMQSTPVLLVVGGIFFAMGASMLGAFDLTLPSSMQTKLQSGPKAGVAGAFFMGIVTGLVASPCVGPVVVVLLTWVAQIGSVGLGFLLLFVFALGLGMLFLLIGTFAGALNALPQAGGWMDTVKHFFGVILLAMGIFYVRSLIGPTLTWTISGVFLILLGTFLGAFRPVGEDSEKSVLFRKGFGIVLLLAGSFVFLVGLARYTNVSLPSRGAAVESSGAASKHEGLDWVSDDVAGLAQAKAQGKPAVIDFYADWCAACKELDEKTWSDGDIRREGSRFVAIKMDLTKKNERSARKQTDYGVPGLPTVIFYDASGKEVKRFFGFRPPAEVLAWMKEIR